MDCSDIKQRYQLTQAVELIDYLGRDVRKGVPVKLTTEDGFAPVTA